MITPNGHNLKIVAKNGEIMENDKGTREEKEAICMVPTKTKERTCR